MARSRLLASLILTPDFQIDRWAVARAIDLIGERIPDETTILCFCHLVGKQELGEQISQTVKAYLKESGRAMKQGLIINTNLIAAPVQPLSKPEAERGGATRTWSAA